MIVTQSFGCVTIEPASEFRQLVKQRPENKTNNRRLADERAEAARIGPEMVVVDGTQREPPFLIFTDRRRRRRRRESVYRASERRIFLHELILFFFQEDEKKDEDAGRIGRSRSRLSLDHVCVFARDILHARKPC